jgi:hypothetical protein
MSEIKKRGSAEEFEAGVGFGKTPSTARQSEATNQGFEAGVVPSQTGSASRPAAAEPATPRVEAQPVRPVAPQPEPVSADSAEAKPKKRYYTPQEVMKKKGCIGCGGMILAIPVIISAVALAIAIF